MDDPSPNPTDAATERLRRALDIANIPTLLLVLVQMTGATAWLEDPYQPSRARGMNDNDSGGLSPERQAAVRSAALAAILAWRDGRPLAIAEPSPALCVQMLSVAMAETIPADYAAIIAAELPLTILEKSGDLGGIWRDNRYPGAGVDTPNHLYSYTFAPYDWSMFFALRDELHTYLAYVADQFDLRRHIRFGAEVRTADYDQAAQCWRVAVEHADGSAEVRSANLLISAVGIFNPIKLPNIPGLDRFAGRCFHSAEWPQDLDLTGKRVAIIGNGASAMQICPEIQHQVAALTIYQRGPHWAAPNPQFRKPIADELRFLLREVPLYRAWYRLRLGWTYGDQVHSALQKDPIWPHPERSLNKANDSHRGYFTHYILSELGDRSDRVPPARLLDFN